MNDTIKFQPPKKEKGRIKLVSLIIFCVLLGGLIAAVVIFKNTAVKIVIQNSLESAFGAKCDVGSTELEIFNARLRVRNLAVADKNAPMKNLFEFSDMVIDFDLTQLLRSRFVADEVRFEGVSAGTPRKTSGVLPAKKQKSPEKPKEPSAFEMQVKDMLSQASFRANAGVQQVLDQYNPQNMLESYVARLKTPQTAAQAETQIREMVTYWTQTGGLLVASGTAVYESADTLVGLQNASGSDIEKIKTVVVELNKLINNAQKFQEETEKAVQRLQKDGSNASRLSSDIQGAVASDMRLVNAEISKITSFSLKDGERLLTGALDTVALSVLGTCYPIAQKGMQLLAESQKNAKNSVKSEKKRALSRLQGRTIEYQRAVPSVLIRTVSLSGADAAGSFAITGGAHNISNNADLLNKPVDAQFTISSGEISGKLGAVVDLRSKVAGKPVALSFAASGIPASIRIPLPSEIAGVPAIDGNASVTAAASFDFSGDFDFSANFAVNPARLSVAAFEPAFVYDLYSRALASVTSFDVLTKAMYEPATGFRLSLSSDADKRLAAGLTTVINEEMSALKKQVTAQVRQTLDEYTAGFKATFVEFESVKKQINAEKARIEAFTADLEKQRKDWEAKIKSQAADAVRSQLQNAASDVLKKFF